MIAYKVFNSDWTCRHFQFEIGKEYKIEGKLIICENGFHACEKISNCFNYYDFDPKNKVAEVEILGDVVFDDSKNKLATNHIKIVREIAWDEVLKLCNTGDCNTGNCNTGDRNTGDCNTGDCNTGDRNTGDRNTGDRNTGDWNTGDWNTGNCNTGDRNTGDWNTGDWNTGDRNTGIFNTNNPDQYRVFNKWISDAEYNSINLPSFLYFNLSIWISHDTASPEERERYKQEIETCGGFLKKIDYKEAFKKSWDNAQPEDRIKIKNIPGFDKDLFYEISGILVD